MRNKSNPPPKWTIPVLAGHREVSNLACTCGAEFKTRAKIARHRQKWNSDPILAETRLVTK